MGVRDTYCKMPDHFAIPLAVLVSLIIAAGLSFLSMWFMDRALGRPDAEDYGTGALVMLVGLNVAISAFIMLISILMGVHHRASWLTPTIAFGCCIVLVRLLGPFDIQFAPFMLGSGATAWLISCWFLRTKESSTTKHVL
jgi:O-antigen/teichoic acid export membrane protein